MANVGSVQFSYDTLKAAYDSDPKVAEIIADFTQDTVTLKTSELDDLKTKKRTKGKNKVKQMAKKAVDLKDL